MSNDDGAAKIRPYNVSTDEKLVRFMIGKSNMEALASANNKTYFHPLMLAVWVALSAGFIQLMQWWPSTQHGFLSYLKPLPALASTAVPLMFFADWINRPYFEDMTQEVLKRPDVQDIQKYYANVPASGFWLLEFGDRFVGLIGIDASQPSRKAKKDEDATPKTAIIRHIHVEDPYRPVGIQADLIDYAVEQAFTKDPKLERIEVEDSPLRSYLRPAFRQKGLELDHHTNKVGILGWKMGVRYLNRANWAKRTKQ